MRTLPLLLVVLLLASGCVTPVTLATVENGCAGNYADLCRYYVALEARCQSSPTVPSDDRELCAAQVRQAYRDDVYQREQQRARDVSDNIMRGQRSVCGRATGGRVPCGGDTGASPPAPIIVAPPPVPACQWGYTASGAYVFVCP